MSMEQADESIDKLSDTYHKLLELRRNEVPILPTIEVDKKLSRDNLKKAFIFLLKINAESLLLAVVIASIVVYKACSHHLIASF